MGPTPCLGGSSVFCDDFDQDTTFLRWNGILQGPGRSVVVDQRIASSPPGSLLARIESSVTDDCAYARPVKTIAGAFTRARLSMSFRAEGPESLQRDAVAAVIFDVPTGVCATFALVNWLGSNYELTIIEQTSEQGNKNERDVSHDTTIRFQKQTWEHLEVSVDYLKKEAAVIDQTGRTVATIPLQLACPYVPAPATAAVGFHCSSHQAITREMRADDVVFDPN
jgi:hypothetical protein